jgi:transposase
MRCALENCITAGTLKVTIQASGWCDRNVAISYLIWLRTIGSEGKVVLIWDVYEAHRSVLVKSKAKEWKIWLIYIPPG